MHTYPSSEIKALISRLHGCDSPYPTVDERHTSATRQLISAFADGRFSDALPYPLYDHLFTWVKEQIADGQSELVVSLATGSGGVISFLYEIASDGSGLWMGPAIEIAVPADESDTDIDPTMIGKPTTVVDVSALRKRRMTA